MGVLGFEVYGCDVHECSIVHQLFTDDHVMFVDVQRHACVKWRAEEEAH